MVAVNDEEIRKFWMKSILEQYGAVHPRDRQRARWRASRATLELLRRILDEGSLLAWRPLLSDDEVQVCGRPVDIDEAAEGIVLCVPEIAR